LTAPRLTLATLLAVLLLAAPAAANRTFTLRAGPYTMGGYDTQFIKERVPAPQFNGSVVRMHASLVDARGRRVTIRDGMLHHVFFRNADVLRVKGHCTARQPEVFYSTGEENETLALPHGYGYGLRKHADWRLSAMLMSHRMAPKRVYIQYSVRVSRDPTLKPVRPLWVRANGCGPASSYGIRGDGGPGSVDDRVEHWRVPISGRIVAAGGHLHAGAVGLQVRQPACGNRLLYDNAPHFAAADALVYTARPMLHEAGPISTTWWSSASGIPVRAGETLDVHGLYDGAHARGAVMAITHLYIAPDETAPTGCPPLPADAQTSPAPPGSRPTAPYIPIPLWRLDRTGRPVRMAQPAARATALGDNALISLRTSGFSPSNVTVPAGGTLRWRFADRLTHNLTFASGPRAMGGQNGGLGTEIATRFDTPGRYQLFCYLHPMTMREQVTVLPAAR
jgi:plastocyanin